MACCRCRCTPLATPLAELVALTRSPGLDQEHASAMFVTHGG